MKKTDTILIVGNNDLIENGLRDGLKTRGFKKVYSSTQERLNVFSQKSVEKIFLKIKPRYIFLSSLRSGGIAANQKFPADFIYANLQGQNNIIHESYRAKAKKLLFVASSCVYPKQCPQPIKEEYLLAGPFEKTNEAYSIAKLAGIGLCQAYRRQYRFNAVVIVPATVYGPSFHKDLTAEHVLGALMCKFRDAALARKKEVVVWGSGKPKREFIYIDDFVRAAIFVMQKYNKEEILNVGCNQDVSIRQLAKDIARVVGFKGKIRFDTSCPDGAKRKLLDSRRIRRMGFVSKISLKDGISKTFEQLRAR